MTWRPSEWARAAHSPRPLQRSRNVYSHFTLLSGLLFRDFRVVAIFFLLVVLFCLFALILFFYRRFFGSYYFICECIWDSFTLISLFYRRYFFVLFLLWFSCCCYFFVVDISFMFLYLALLSAYLSLFFVVVFIHLWMRSGFVYFHFILLSALLFRCFCCNFRVVVIFFCWLYYLICLLSFSSVIGVTFS